MKNIKKTVAILLTAIMMMAMSTVAFAENTDDSGHLSIAADQPFDVCMHNTWANKDCGCFYATIDNVRVTMTISGFSGDAITTQLIMRESETWNHWQSEAIEIAGDGTYEYYIDMADKFVEDAETGEMVGGSFASENLLVLYVKDVKVCTADETPLGEEVATSGVTCEAQIDSIVFNAGDVTAAPEEDEVTEAIEDAVDEAIEEIVAEVAEETPEVTATADETADVAAEAVVATEKKGLPVPAIIAIVVAGCAVVAGVIIVIIKKKK